MAVTPDASDASSVVVMVAVISTVLSSLAQRHHARGGRFPMLSVFPDAMVRVLLLAVACAALRLPRTRLFTTLRLPTLIMIVLPVLLQISSSAI